MLGGVAGYFLGFYLWEHGLREFAHAHIPGFTPDRFNKVGGWYGGPRGSIRRAVPRCAVRHAPSSRWNASRLPVR
ncbi:MAG: hypothetical protein FJ265_02275 [Planctomycetes bacterium]|nr:hypothetical protein [Planctomycetota bacterium]